VAVEAISYCVRGPRLIAGVSIAGSACGMHSLATFSIVAVSDEEAYVAPPRSTIVARCDGQRSALQLNEPARAINNNEPRSIARPPFVHAWNHVADLAHASGICSNSPISSSSLIAIYVRQFTLHLIGISAFAHSLIHSGRAMIIWCLNFPRFCGHLG